MSKNEDKFYSRLNEFGEYKYKNSLDVLFILQLTFIVILIFIALYYLSTFGFFSKASMYIVTILLTIILMLIIINKIIVMPKLRNKFIYDSYNFGNGKQTPTTTYVNAGKDNGDSGTSPNSTCETQLVCSQELQI